MNIREIIRSDHFKLFFKREGKVVLGKHYANLWLLCSVMFVTFLAIAFSNASLNYLDFKMNDPFINWVDIKNNNSDNDFVGFEQNLGLEEVRQQYHYIDYQTDKYAFTLFSTKDLGTINLDCRFFADITTPLVEAILDEENVIGNHRITTEKICNESFGVIITHDALVSKLGYKDEVPAFIYYRAHCNPAAGDDFCIDILNDYYVNVPIPVLAVVKRLPTNMDIIGTKHFYLQNTARMLSLDNQYYHNNLLYWVPADVDAAKFTKFLEEKTVATTDLDYYPKSIAVPNMECHKEGTFVSLRFEDEDEVNFQHNRTISDAVLEEYSKKGVVRIYNYDKGTPIADPDDYISVHFSDLNQIGEFQQYAKENFKINIEMSQISAKENFNEVSIMANILSWTMIIFAIVCIILFIVNLLQSYFQKVKRNLGTFKAFGISNNVLICVYVLIMIVTVCSAIAISFAASFLIQEILPLLGILKDGAFNYLDIWSGKMLGAIIIIIFASISTVYIVMHNLLKATPGDLIYDR